MMLHPLCWMSGIKTNTEAKILASVNTTDCTQYLSLIGFQTHYINVSTESDDRNDGYCKLLKPY